MFDIVKGKVVLCDVVGCVCEIVDDCEIWLWYLLLVDVDEWFVW